MKNTWDSEQVGGIIMDSETGAIYGLGIYPNFDPNNFSGQDILLFNYPFV